MQGICDLARQVVSHGSDLSRKVLLYKQPTSTSIVTHVPLLVATRYKGMGMIGSWNPDIFPLKNI